MRCLDCGELTVPYGGEDVCQCPPERRCERCWAVEEACLCDDGPGGGDEDDAAGWAREWDNAGTGAW